MKRFIIFITIFLYSSFCFANTMTYIEKDKPVPFSGFLLDMEALAKIQVESRMQKKMCELDLNFAKQKAKNKEAFEKKTCEISIKAISDRMKAINEIHKKEIEKYQKMLLKGKGFDMTPIWIGVGFVIGAGVATIISLAIVGVLK